MNFTILTESTILTSIMPDVWLFDARSKEEYFKNCINFDDFSPPSLRPQGGQGLWISESPPLHPFVLSDSGDLKMLLTSNHKIISFNFTKVFHTKRFMLMFFLCLKCIKRRININKLIWTLLSNFISTL